MKANQDLVLRQGTAVGLCLVMVLLGSCGGEQASCRSDADCQAGKHCDLAAGICVDDQAAGCQTDEDCGASEVCLSSECRPAPCYLLLFTHTEDHINHGPSEERFRRFFPKIAELAAAHPDARVSWTVEFMGADTETIARRNADTGMLDLILGYAGDTQVFQFGYHAAHEPTYDNNPLRLLPTSAGWEEIVDASLQLLTLGKDPVLGGIDPGRPGGLKLVQDTFGPARIVSGFGYDQAQIHASDSLASGYVMFGFADHGAPSQSPGYKDAVKSFVRRLCPERRTPCGIFWMDGQLRVNDGNPVEEVGLLGVSIPRDALQTSLARLDEARVQVMNVHIAPKFLYALESPTNYAYAHPQSPELPPSLLRSAAEKEQLYQSSFDNLEFLAGTYLPSKPGSRFVSGPDLLGLFDDPRGQAVSRERVLPLAQALVDGFGSAPPDFVKAQGSYYTLAEAWSLLVQAVDGYRGLGALPDSITLWVPKGPLAKASSLVAAVELPSTDILEAAGTLAPWLSPAQWTALPVSIIPAQVAVGAKTLNAAEFLQACARLVLAVGAGDLPVTISVAPAALLPEIASEAIFTVRPVKFPGVAWSVKPARHR